MDFVYSAPGDLYFTDDDIEAAAPYYVADIMGAWNFLAACGEVSGDKDAWVDAQADEYEAKYGKN